jgi:hypothetical protein
VGAASGARPFHNGNGAPAFKSLGDAWADTTTPHVDVDARLWAP